MGERARGVEIAGLIAALGVVSLVTRVAFFGVGFTNVDEGAHLVGARELLLGGHLYVDFADNKPPLIYVYYAIARELFGAGPFGVRVFTAVIAFPAVAACMAAFYDFDRRGSAAAIAFLVASAVMLPSDAHAINGEHVFLLPLAASVALVRSPNALGDASRMLLAGALVGIASLAKQPAALCGAAFAWSILRASDLTPSRRALSIASLTVGFIAPIAATAALFAHQGSLGAFVFWVYRYNLVHVQNPMLLSDRVIQFFKMGSVLIPSVGVLAYAYARAPRGELPIDVHRRRLVASLVVTTLLPAFLGWRLFGHYFLPLVFALSLGAGAFFTVKRLDRTIIVSMLAIGFLAFTIAGRIVHDPARNLTDVDDPRYERIAAAMPARCDTARPLFVWGYAPELYVQSDLRPASRFVVPIDTISGHIVGNDSFARGAVDTKNRIVPEHWDWLMGDLERSRPEYVVDTAPADLNHWSHYPVSDFPRLEAFVRRDYRELANIGGAIIYRRNDCP